MVQEWNNRISAASTNTIDLRTEMVISDVIKVKDWTFCEMGVIDQDITWFNLSQYALPVALEDFGYIVLYFVEHDKQDISRKRQISVLNMDGQEENAEANNKLKEIQLLNFYMRFWYMVMLA